MTAHHRLFSPQEATRSLPLVRAIVDEILTKQRELSDLVVVRTSPTPEEKETVARLSDDIRSCVDELEQLGCFYKGLGFEEGLVDFPSTIDGEFVLLCWKSGEEQVEWFHGYDEGFAGRKRIPKRLLQPV